MEWTPSIRSLLERHLALAVLTVKWVVPVSAASYEFDERESKVVVHVPRAGLLSFAGHNHTVAVTSFGGSLDWPPGSPGGAFIVFETRAAALEVLDPGVDAAKRAEIQAKMQSAVVLAPDEHPLIRFESTRIDVAENGEWTVFGRLSIRGVEQELSFPADVQLEGEHMLLAMGVVNIKPEQFGIKPVSALGGAVRTADVIRLEFSLVGRKEGE